MRCYLIRHGKDCDTVRGAWSQYPLTEEGVMQVNGLSQHLLSHKDIFSIQNIFTSDLVRALQTAQILSAILHVPLLELPDFRETNNGDLAGMDNQLASRLFPGLFWNQLGWEQCYPNGESPKIFYERISKAWKNFSQQVLLQSENVALVTHAGVIHVILSLIMELTIPIGSHNRAYPIVA